MILFEVSIKIYYNCNTNKKSTTILKKLFLGGQKSCDHCQEEDTVCSVEGCVKFNPFYLREVREQFSAGLLRSGEKTTGLLRFDSPADNSKTMAGNPDIPSLHLSQGGQALCGVVLDAVWHASQVKKQEDNFN